MSITVAMYSHDSVGLGHARRNRALAYALAADLPRLTGEDVHGLLIAGHPTATADSLPEGWDWLVLPGFTRTSEGYASRRLDVGTERLWHLRSSTAAAALGAIQPDLFIVDRHPFGVDNELLPALEALRGARTQCVLGMREVLDAPDKTAAEWQGIGGAGAVAHYYHQLWVYGDQAVYDPLSTGEIPAELKTRTHFTGYLSHGRPDDPVTSSSVRSRRPYVVTMVGGGSDGGQIGLNAAKAQVPEHHTHIILTGPQMPQADHARIVQTAEENPGETRVARFAPHVPKLVRDASAVISMGGYNSLAEIMATSTPALIIPRASRREEQPRRAKALAAAGAVDCLSTTHLSPDALGTWMRTAVTRRTSRDHVDLDGLMRVGQMAAAAIGSPAPASLTSTIADT